MVLKVPRLKQMRATCATARRRACLLAYLLAALSPLLCSDAFGQCILANPSFELGGSGGATFAGWSQFGSVGPTSEATHGAVAARVTGPGEGGRGVSGFWQQMDSAPGEQWEVSAWVQNSASNPLTGQSRAFVNVEWRDSGGNLISSESHTAADASAAPGAYHLFLAVSGPAPAGTASAHLLLGVLQGPADPAPDVFYDQVTFYSLSPPTIYEQQWHDFPGGRVVDFSGRTWRVKGFGYYEPGPCLFNDSPYCVWVDGNGRLHLTITRCGETWYSSEVALVDTLGYGDYIFTTVGRLDLLDPNAVLGLFIKQYGPCYDPSYLWWNPYNEFDVEFSRWGDPTNDIGEYVAQPYDYTGNVNRFDAGFSDGELTSHAFRWLPDRVECRSWRGGPFDESPSSMIHSWTYEGPHVPRPELPRVRMNLWQYGTHPATEQEAIFDDFTFVPADGATHVAEPSADDPVDNRAARLCLTRPNPSSSGTAIGYSLEVGMDVEIAVYDVSGRRVQTLLSGFVTAGRRELNWNGRDDGGHPVASGVYLVMLHAGDIVRTTRMALVR